MSEDTRLDRIDIAQLLAEHANGVDRHDFVAATADFVRTR